MNRQLQFLKKLTVLFSVSLLLCFTSINAQTLNPGDLAVIGWNAITDRVAIVTLVDIPAGTVIKITDNGWNQSINAFTVPPNPPTASDGVVTWTLSSMVPAGTVLELFLGGADDGTTLTNLTTSTNLTSNIVSSGFASNDAMILTGDQIFIYQGVDTSPFFIFGMNNSAGPVDANNWNNNVPLFALRDSNLPNGTGSLNGLTNGVNAIGLPGGSAQQDNVQYVGATTTTDRYTWLARITDIANWEGSDANDLTNPITLAPTPIVHIDLSNNPPTDIALSNASVNQSAGINAEVGTLTTTDPDAGNTFTYTLMSGVGGEDNTSFNISGNALRANNAAALVAGTYNVRIRTTDNAGGTYDKPFTIIVVDDLGPTVTISSDKASLKAGETATLTFTLNEASEDFEEEDIIVTGGTLSDFSGSGTSYSATFTPTDNVTVTATIDVNAGMFTDAVGNSNFAATQLTIAIDTEVPSGYAVSIDQATITVFNQTAMSFTFSGAEVGATFDYTITSSGGGTAVTGSGGPLTAATQTVSNINVSGLANGTLTLSVTLTDASGNEGAPVTDHVTKAANNPPVIMTSSGPADFVESVDGPPVPVTLDAALTVTDPDNTTLTWATVTITGQLQSGEDILDFENSSELDIAGSYDAGAGVLTLTSPGGTATLPEWQAVLRTVTYSNTSMTPSTATRTVTFVVSDGMNNSAGATKIVTITAVNNAPIITNLHGDAVTFTENGPAVLLDVGGNATVSDHDSPDFNGGSLTVSIITNGVAGEDALAIRNEGMAAGQIGVAGGDVYYGGIPIGLLSGGAGGADLIVTFLPPATAVAAQDLIRNLTYSNSNTTDPSPDPRTIRITLNDGDGATSSPSDLTVNITTVNDPPVVTTSGGAVTFTEPEDGDPVPVTVDPGLTVVDPDNTTLVSATISITGNFQAGEDGLVFVNDGSTMDNIMDSYDAGTGILTLTSAGSTATLAEWQAALRAVTYSNSSQNPNTALRTVSFVVNDGTDDSNPATKNIHVVAVNTAPIAVDDEVTVTEDTPATGNVLTNDSDPEGNALTASLTVAPVNGTIVLNADGSFTYSPNTNYNGPDSFEYQVCDNGMPSRCDTAWVYLTIEAVNDAPTITAPATIAANEDIPTPLTGISFADVDAGSAVVTVTFSVASGTLSAPSGGGVTVSGSETGMLTLVGAIADLNAFIAAGNMSFTTALDETDDVTLTVHIDDGGNTGIDPGNSGTDDSEAATTTVTITVTALNDAPVNTVPVSQTIDQNEPLVFSTGNGNAISVSDVDAGGGVIRVTLTATNGLLTLSGTAGLHFLTGSGTGDGTVTFDGTLAGINPALNGLAFVPISGYNGPASLQITTDDLGLTGSDGPKTDTDLIDITVNPVDPVVIAVGSTNADGTYKINEVIHVTVAFDQVVTVDETGGSPSLLLETGDTDREAIYASGSGNDVLTFSYTVQAGDMSADLDYVSTAALLLNGATIQNASGNDAVFELPAVGSAHSIAGQHDIAIDGVAPAVTSVTVPADGYHVENDPLDFTVHFSEHVAVDETGGTPHLELTIGTATVQAIYVSGSGSNALAFRYVVQAGDTDLDGIDVGGSLVLDGGTIRDAAGNDALPVLHQTGLTDDVRVYAVHPSVALSTEATSHVNTPFTLVVTFDEPVTGFAVGDITASNATVSNLQTTDHITYTALVTPTADGTVSIQVPADVAQNVGNNGNTASNMLSLAYDGTAPVVTAVDVPADGYYREGDVLTFTVYMDDDVAVHTDDGTPYLAVVIGTVTRQAGYVGGTGTDALTFSYTVQADDQDLDGIALGSDLILNGGTIGDAAGNDVGLTLNGGAPTDGIFVYSVRPTVTLSTDAVSPVNAPFTVTVTFSEAVTGFSLDDMEATNAVVSELQTTDNMSYTVRVTPSIGGVVQLSVPANAGANVANNGNLASNTLSVTYSERITGITFEDDSFVYDGTAKSLAIKGTLPDGVVIEYVNNSRTDAGTQEVTATLSGDNYETLVLTADLTVTQATITGITFEDDSFVYDGTAKSLAIKGILPDGVAVEYANNSRTDAGTQEVTATLSGDNYETLVLTADLTVTQATITGITFEDDSFVYDGTAKSLAIKGILPDGVAVEYANNSRTDAGTQEVTATLSGDNYETLVLTADLTVTPTEQTLVFPPLPEKIYGDPNFDAGATASSGEAVSYTSSNPSVAEITPGGLVRITGAGETILTATVPENANYSNRPEAARVLTVRKATQAITFNAPSEVNRDAGSISLDLSASSGLPVTLTLDDPEVAVLNGTVLNVLRLGTVRITAVQEGDANYEAADPVTVTVRVIDPKLELPIRIHKAVSPNGDGINEYLIIEAIKDYPENRVRIFNRNGTVVYEASGYNNGTVAFRGIGTGQQRLPAGTYFYTAEIRVNGEWRYEKGWFVLRY
ncbi:MAG: gliding motility-associated C-terminal domain-containing protein [Parapedobacter sp.]|nr:MAG: gliding motility-associated C-terminal domain-containing protein [Parapedobacter sp.]